MIEAGQTISDLSHQLMYDELSITGKDTVQITVPVEYDLARGIYYIEYLWGYGQWIGDMDILINKILGF